MTSQLIEVSIHGDDIRLSVAGKVIGSWGARSEEGQALLKLRDGLALSGIPATGSGETAEAVYAGWNACRTDIYRLCEDMQEKPFSDGTVLRGLGPTPMQEAHSKGFNAGWAHAAKSIARAFASFEAADADRVHEVLAKLSPANPAETQADGAV